MTKSGSISIFASQGVSASVAIFVVVAASAATPEGS
jgi:hypothetical protein